MRFVEKQTFSKNDSGVLRSRLLHKVQGAKDDGQAKAHRRDKAEIAGTPPKAVFVRLPKNRPIKWNHT